MRAGVRMLSGAAGRRALALAALLAVVVLVLVLALRGERPYTLHARFRDASQLIAGNLVEVGGIKVGTVAKLQLTPDGVADAVLHVDRGRFTPLHEGTVAAVGTVGLSGVANRFVALRPGPTANPSIPDGGTLELSRTQPVVDLDLILNSITPTVRSNVRGVIQGGRQALTGRAKQANRALRYLDPAVTQSAALLAQLDSDRQAFSSLVRAGSQVAGTLAAHRGRLAGGIADLARVLRALAAQRITLADALSRAAPVIQHATGTLRTLRGTLASVRPAVREARPLGVPLARLLRVAVPSARAATPVLAQLSALLPSLDSGLDLLPGLSRAALPALNETATAVARLTPIGTGLRPYAPDIVQGILRGTGGGASADYDANGHYVRVAPLGAPDTVLGTLLGAGGQTLTGFHTGLLAPCAGGATQPAADNSNPFVPDPSVCNAADNVR